MREDFSRFFWGEAGGEVEGNAGDQCRVRCQCAELGEEGRRRRNNQIIDGEAYHDVG